MAQAYLELISDIKKACLEQMNEEDIAQYQKNEALLRKRVEAILSAYFKNKRDIYVTVPERQTILAQIISDILGMGPIEKLLHDPEVTEIMVNGHSQVYIERNGKLELTNIAFRDEEHLTYFIEKIISPLGRRVTESEPYIDARLKNGSRVNVVVYPVSLSGAILTIRKFSSHILTMEDLIHRKALSQQAADFLAACVKARANIIVSGCCGVGKTTMLDVLSHYILPDERVIIVEDTAELQFKGRHIVHMETRPSNIDGKGEITIRHLIKNALHMRPDRIIVGEVRSNEVLDMLQAMTTGHEGSMATMHANSSLEALDRLELLTLMGNTNISAMVARRQIISAIDLSIHMVRRSDGLRKIVQISELNKNNREEFCLQDVFSAGDSCEEDLQWTGRVPLIYPRLKAHAGYKNESFDK